MEKTNLYKKLVSVQFELKAPKGQRNNFGNYNYRSCEDILEAVKPLLDKYNVALTIRDEIVLIGDRFYVKATATLIDADTGETVEASAFARESADKKGMDVSQLTGATSSYARKYALNGLFAIDDNKDADATNTHGKDTIKVNMTPSGLSEAQLKRLFVIANKAGVTKATVEAQIKKEFKCEAKNMTKEQYQNICERLEKKSK